MTEAPPDRDSTGSEADAPANAGGKQEGGRFQKGRSGNPRGKAKGVRHRLTILAESLLEADAEEIVKAVIDAAKGGDMQACRLILERIIPPARDRAVAMKLPTLKTAADASRAMAAITGAVARGEITPGEAKDLASLVEAFTRIVEAKDHEERLAAIEEKVRDQ
jgi:Family of unknown function (DUF5681)